MKPTKSHRLTSTLTPPVFQNFSPIDSAENPDIILQREKEAQELKLANMEAAKKKWKMPLLRFRVHDVCHPGASMFFDAVNPKRLMEEAVRGVIDTLYTAETAPTSIRSVTLILRPMSGVAYTKGSDLDKDHKEIHLSMDYLKGVHERSEGKLDESEILGIIRHEMVHCFQFNGKPMANGGLVEGIADWVRYKAGFIPPHWKEGGGNNWDDGYQTTAYFLLYLEQRFGADTVPRINEYMREKKYCDDLWKELFDFEVKHLWKEYKKSLGEGDDDDKKPVVPAPPVKEESCEDLMEKDEEENEEEHEPELELDGSPVVVEHPNTPSVPREAQVQAAPAQAPAQAQKHATPQDIPYLSEPFVAAQHENDGKKHVLIAATGSVASIKIPLILKKLSIYRKLSVRVVLTTASLLFLPPLQTLLEIPNVDGVYLDHHEWPSQLSSLLPTGTGTGTETETETAATPSPIPHRLQTGQSSTNRGSAASAIWAKVGDPILHIELRRWAHILVIAPLSANSLAKITSGMTDNLLLSVIRAWDRSRTIAVAPAMNTLMWEHPLTQQQLKLLGDDTSGTNTASWDWFKVLKPANKALACGDVGTGAMKEWSEMVAWLVGKMELVEGGSEAR